MSLSLRSGTVHDDKLSIGSILVGSHFYDPRETTLLQITPARVTYNTNTTHKTQGTEQNDHKIARTTHTQHHLRCNATRYRHSRLTHALASLCVNYSRPTLTTNLLLQSGGGMSDARLWVAPCASISRLALSRCKNAHDPPWMLARILLVCMICMTCMHAITMY